jgi:probable phosphoglycerate mutase
MELLVIRHGRPVKDQRTDEAADPELSEIGWNQCRATAEFLKGEQIDHVVASTMIRAHQTAMPTAEMLGVDIELRSDIVEVDAHSNEYIPYEEMELDGETIRQYEEDPYYIFNGDYEGFRSRVVAGFDEVINNNRGKRVAVFCHGMVTAVYLQSILDQDDPFFVLVDYCGISRIKANSSGLRSVVSVNETGHVRGLNP